MSGSPGVSVREVGAWATLSRRLSPYLDLILGVLAAVLSVTSLLGTDVDAIDPRLVPTDPLSLLLTAAAGLSLVQRRTRPVVSFAVFTGCCLAITLSHHYIGLLSVVMLFSLYSLAVHGGRRVGILGLVASIIAFNLLALLDVPDLATSDLLQAFAALVVAWAVGDAMRARRSHQAERLRVAEQEAAAAHEQAERAVVEERLRIARELHDVVAHSMSLIAVQAGVGAHVIRTDVDAAEHALEVIAETSRKALVQTRSMLGLLRTDDSGPAVAPAPSIDDLDSLAGDVRAAGVGVEVLVEGPVRPLEAAVDLTAYRIVQESLTNVLRHSGATHAVVRLRYDEQTIDLEVRDPGVGERTRPTAPHGSSGHGLLGLRERTRLLGGALDYGPDGSGFCVHAHLPARALEPS